MYMCRQPIRSQVWKFLLTNMDFNVVEVSGFAYPKLDLSKKQASDNSEQNTTKCEPRTHF